MSILQCYVELRFSPLYDTLQLIDIRTAHSFGSLTLGYLEFLGQPSIATMILCPSKVDACRVSMRMRGIRRSAGVNKCRVD